MMQVRSYVDPISFVRFLHVDANSAPDHLREPILSVDQEEFNELFWENRYEFIKVSTEVHETLHYWQGLRYPYLHWYAFMATRATMDAIIRLANSSKDFHSWSCYIPALTRFIQRPRFLMKVMRARGLIEEVLIDFSDLEVLECATSLLEWQLTTDGDPCNAQAYRRWTKRNPSYTSAYDFACRYVNDEQLVIRFFAPLVGAAFRTSQPAIAFCRLLSYMSSRQMSYLRFIAQKEPCRWPDLFDVILKELSYDEPEPGRFETNKFFMIDNALGIKLSNTQTGHPLLFKDTLAWEKLCASDPAYKWVIHQPRFASNDVITSCFESFYPPLSVVRIHAGDRSRNVLIGRPTGYGGTSLDDLPAGKAFMHSWITLLGLVRRAAGVHLDETNRLCHHSLCAEYGPNFCNGYSIAPRDHRACKFPAFVNNTIGDMLEHKLGGFGGVGTTHYPTERRGPWNPFRSLWKRVTGPRI